MRCFFFDHGHDLSDAARLIAGAPGEARVISLALRLDRAAVLDDGTRRNLAALHALLALDDVREGDPVETFLPTGPGPATRKVEAICLLTDLLGDLLLRIDNAMGESAATDITLRTIPTAEAA